jgi:hypothetical protein
MMRFKNLVETPVALDDLLDIGEVERDVLVVSVAVEFRFLSREFEPTVDSCDGFLYQARV